MREEAYRTGLFAEELLKGSGVPTPVLRASAVTDMGAAGSRV